MVSRLRPHQLGLLMGVAGYTVISFESFGIRVAGLGEWDTAFWFGLFTAIAMSMLVPARTGRSLPSAVKDGGWVMVASGILQAMSTIFFILAIQFTTVSNAVVIFAATPVLAALVGRQPQQVAARFGKGHVDRGDRDLPLHGEDALQRGGGRGQVEK